MHLDGVSAAVTGGASGLGRATAEALIAAGARVTVLDLDDAKGGELERVHDGAARYVKTDVADEMAVNAALDAAESAFGPLRLAVNCAGIGPGAKTVGRDGAHPLDLFRKVIEVNLIGTFNVLRLAAARMVAAEADSETGERGVVVNTASIAAFDGQIGQVAYAASKGGIAGLTLPAARDLAKLGIRVVTIAPGLFKTPLFEGMPEDVVESLSANVPFPHRLGDPKEFAALVRHVAENPYFNGETIRLDAALRMPPR